MRWTPRAALVGAALAACGCGGADQLPDTKSGSFLTVEGAVNDIVSTVMSPNYRTTGRDLGTDSDRIGLARWVEMHIAHRRRHRAVEQAGVEMRQAIMAGQRAGDGALAAGGGAVDGDDHASAPSFSSVSKKIG